ncbi:hypothetical protein Q3A80_23600 [Burkholderia sp. SR8]|uniref:hypothetical protein n=1 Tax=Burkholderia sp. SR8 TaxID=3062277 RepID=UPI004062A871
MTKPLVSGEQICHGGGRWPVGADGAAGGCGNCCDALTAMKRRDRAPGMALCVPDLIGVEKQRKKTPRNP